MKFSQFFADALGQSRSSFEGKHLKSLLDTKVFCHADVSPLTGFEGLPWYKALSGERVCCEEWVLKKPDGKLMFVQVDANAIIIEGNVVGSVGSWEDITYRKGIGREL